MVEGKALPDEIINTKNVTINNDLMIFDYLSPSANKIIEEFMKMGIPLPDELTNEAIFEQYDWV